MACVVQGLGKVVCQPLVMWLCVDPQSVLPPFNELILGWEIRQINIVIRLLKEMNFKCRLLST
jgi:hypothetical protein